MESRNGRHGVSRTPVQSLEIVRSARQLRTPSRASVSRGQGDRTRNRLHCDHPGLITPDVVQRPATLGEPSWCFRGDRQ